MKRRTFCPCPVLHRRWLTSLRRLVVGVILVLTASSIGRPADATRQQSAARTAASFTFQGRVYEGEVGDQSRPVEGVSVTVYGAANPYPDPGHLIATTTTNAEGWYGLTVEEGWEFYSIREDNPSGYESVGATSVDGTVRDPDWIEYVSPLGGLTLTGNKFWDRSNASPTPTPTMTGTTPPTATPTATPTMTGTTPPTSTPTATPTMTGTTPPARSLQR